MPSPEDVAAAHQRRLAIVGYIIEYTATHGYGPSRTDINRQSGVSPATTDKDLRWLRDQGHVEWEHNKPRTIRVQQERPGP